MICVYALALLISVQLPQQEAIAGCCLDAEDGRPLAGALVRALDDKEKTLVYTITDADGFFSIRANEKVASLELSLLGYQKIRKSPPFGQHLEVRLEPSAEHLQQAIVTANKVRMSGDTIQYNIKALKTQEDRVLGDALNRLPGIEVTDGGRIRVDGKEIGQFLVDGKDILDNNYDLAVRKLSVDAIASVEVIRGHQRMKILQGLENTEDAAVNILLDESARRKVNLSGSLGGGIESRDKGIPLTAEVNAFYVQDKWSSVNAAAFDADGSLLKEATSLPIAAEVRRYNLPSRFDLSPISAPIGHQGMPFNKTMDFRSVNTFAPNQVSSAAVSITYAKDHEESCTEQRSTYHSLQSDEYALARRESRNETQDRLLGHFRYVKNDTNIYLDNSLAADLGFGRGFADVSGDITQNTVAQTDSWSISNAFNINWSSRNGNVYGIESYTQWSGVVEQMTLSVGDIRQTVNRSSIWQELSFRGLSAVRNHWTWSLVPRTRWQGLSDRMSLTGIPTGILGYPTEGKTSVSCLSAGLGWGISWAPAPFRLEAGGLIHYDIVRLDSRPHTGFSPDFFLLGKYEGGRLSLECRLGVTQPMPDSQQLGVYPVLTDYLFFRCGSGSVLFSPQGSARLRLNVREPINGWDIRSSLSYTQAVNQIQGRVIEDPFIVNYISDETARLRTLSSQVTVSKGLFAVNGKITTELSYTSSSSDYIQGSEKVAFTASIPMASFKFTATPSRFWTTSFDVRCTWSRMTVNQASVSTTMNLASSFKNSFYPGSNWVLTAQVDAYYNKEVRKVLVFPALSAEWKHKKHFRLKLCANNLLNLREYAHSTLSPMLDNSYTCQIRPLSVMLGANWDF